MTAGTTRWADVTIALTGCMRAVSGYRNPTTRSADVPVFLGTEPLTREMSAPTFLVIGYSGPEGGDPSGSVTQEPAAQAASTRPRDEAGTISCLAVAQRGDTDVTIALTDATAVMAAVETYIRATDPYVGLTASSNIRWTQTQTAEPRMYATDAGCVAEWSFTLNYKARL